MNGQAVAFLVLVLFQLAGTVAFLVLYVASDWRASAVGRHLLFWSASAGLLDLTWVLLLLARWPWLMFVLFAAQAAVGLLTWQRVRLVWRAQRQPVEGQPPGS